MAESTDFSYRAARSGSLMAGLALVLCIESAVLHLWLAQKHPVAAWLLTLSSLATLWWLAADYRAIGTLRIRVFADRIELPIGKRFTARIARTDVQDASQPGWRDLDAVRNGMLNLTKPAEPNVLLQLDEAGCVELFKGVRKRTRFVGLHVDDPAGFVHAVSDRST